MMPGDVAGGAGGGAPAGNQAAPSPEPSPAPPQASTAPAGPSTKAPASKARPLSPAELHARAVDAALDKRCSDVRDLGSQIQAIDLGYYKKFRADPRLKACLETPSQYPARK